jgi:hypothetical protein
VGEREGEREIWGEGGGWAGLPKRGRAGAAGPAGGGPRHGREERGGEREEKKKKKKVFSFLKSVFFLDECIHVFKQSKECTVRHGASSKIKYFRVLLYRGF